jgi:hypothetical protein
VTGSDADEQLHYHSHNWSIEIPLVTGSMPTSSDCLRTGIAGLPELIDQRPEFARDQKLTFFGAKPAGSSRRPIQVQRQWSIHGGDQQKIKRTMT